MQITIQSKINSGTSLNGATSWISFSVQNQRNIIFWGSPEEGTRNIDSIKHQKLPCVIEIDSPEDCIPSQYVAKQYNASISVCEHCYIQILPDF